MTALERRTPPGEAATALWRALKRAGAEGLSATDANERKIAAASYARRTMRAWTIAGVATYTPPATTARDDSGRFYIANDAPALPPMRRTSGEVEVRDRPAMTAERFAAIRRKLGGTLGGMALALGTAGKQPSRARAMKRFEKGERPIDAALAKKVRALGAARVAPEIAAARLTYWTDESGTR